MRETQEKNKDTVFKGLISIMLITIICSLTIAMYAYAKYTTTGGGSSQAQVAKWHLDFKNGKSQDGKTIKEEPVELISTKYNYVKEDTLAPGTEGEFEIIVDTEGTETNVNYYVDINLTNVPRNMRFYRVQGSTETIISDRTLNTDRNIRISKALTYDQAQTAVGTNANDERVITIHWIWPYQTDEVWWSNPTSEDTGNPINANDKIDTEDGRTAEACEMKILARAEQIEYELLTGQVVKKDGVAIDASQTLALNKGDTATLSVGNDADVEAVRYSSSNTGVVTVNSSTGEIEALEGGTAKITITGVDSNATIEINVNVTAPIATIKDANGNNIDLTSENVTDYYGAVVDYKASDSDTATWRIFYVDEEGKYGDEGTIYLKADQVTTTGLSAYKSYNSSDTTIMEKMNQDWATKEKSENNGSVNINNPNEHCVSWLCDTTQWTQYANSDANYAIGAPSVEMYIDSYNKAFGTNYAYKRANTNGYQYSTDGGSSWANSTANNTISTDKNNLYVKSGQYWWLASPCAYDFGSVCHVSGGDFYLYGQPPRYANGVCPLVSLKSGVTPKLK